MAEKTPLYIDFADLRACDGWGVARSLSNVSEYYQIVVYGTGLSHERFDAISWLKKQITDYFGDWNTDAHEVWGVIEFSASGPTVLTLKNNEALVFEAGCYVLGTRANN